MDVPSEPLLLALLACVPLALLLGPGSLWQLAPREWRHPLLLLPFALLLWAGFDTYFSVDKVKSVKYLLAKCWYLVPFLLGTLLVVRRPADVWRLAACYVGGTAASLLWVLPRHASIGFSFGQVNWALQPFYRNHVIYATTLALLLPFAGGLVAGAGTRGRRWLWLGASGLLLFGLLLSYTRASWLAVPVAGLYYVVMRLRLTRVLLLAVALATAGVVTYFVHNENYIRYRPDYRHTTWHGNSFSAHLQSTYRLQDVSGMERVYRWVAAAHMVAARPWTGSGPSTFFPEYKRFTVTSFRTSWPSREFRPSCSFARWWARPCSPPSTSTTPPGHTPSCAASWWRSPSRSSSSSSTCCSTNWSKPTKSAPSSLWRLPCSSAQAPG
jgi:O-antigen ligase